jgi:hypothetical protein
MDIEQWTSELSRFADIDAPVQSSDLPGQWIARFRQRGADVVVTWTRNSDAVSEQRDGRILSYGSYRGLLASPEFGNLALLARLQRAVPSGIDGGIATDDIPVVAVFDDGDSSLLDLPDKIQAWAEGNPSSPGVRVLVIDGPAGIGKTHLIRSLVQRRASSFGPNKPPLVLHIQSRGRQLTTLSDLLAGHLQAFRMSLTFEQVPVLVRHGLLQVAIDGFDELADPNGYETAWHSLNDFMADIGDFGVVLLAGRDTFIDAETVRTALPRLHSKNIAAVHLRPPSPAEAIRWLKSAGVVDEKVLLLTTAGLLSDDSYSLRPFFLTQIRSLLQQEEDSELEEFYSFPLGILVEAMIRREAPIAAQLAPGLSGNEIEELIRQFFREVARDMADYETESVDVPSLQLVAELVFGSTVKSDSLRAIRNRVKSFALLETDADGNRRRFVHTEVQDYFLAQSYLQILSTRDVEIPRSLKRSIVGSDFLDTCHDVAMWSDFELVARLQENCIGMLQRRTHDDRALINVASIVLCCWQESLNAIPLVIEDLALGECVFRQSVASATFRRTSISQLDARGADISSLRFEGCTIVSAIVNPGTYVSAEFPRPQMLMLDFFGKQVRVFKPQDMDYYLGTIQPKVDDSNRTASLGSIGKLLDKLCRTIVRQTWIRDSVDDRAGRLLYDHEWPMLKGLLQEHSLLEERNNKSASGRNAAFVRIRFASEFLDPNTEQPAVLAFRKHLAALVDS